MPSMSPSPGKRPSMAERSSSTLSLSSSGKQQTAQKVHRVGMGRHSRNVSHGKGLSKLGKINSTTNVTADGRNHARKKSGQTTPGPSPKTPVSPHMKKNSSHVNLTKNTSHGNLRKNHSAKELAAARNVSQGNLKKLGAPQAQKSKKDEHKSGFFELGDQSSGEEDEGEWEDSTTTQSPEMSRNHSKASTPLRSHTPNGEHDQKPVTHEVSMLKKVTSPPDAALRNNNNKSAPNLRDPRLLPAEQKPVEQLLLHNQARASRAPPAMSTVSAHVKRTDSTHSFTKISNQDAVTTPTNVPIVGTASSSSHGVSHFLPSSSVATSRKSIEDASDEETSFMSNYKPQPSESPEKSSKMLNKARLSSLPSRTQQRLELQRREMMRAAASPTPTTPGLGLSVGSSVSLHSRSGSKGRNRPLTNDPKALRHDYEAGIKQLTVVRRFRNPIIESIHRLQDTGTVPSETSSILSSIAGTKSRPQSRRGFTNPNSTAPTPKNPMSRSPEDKKSISAQSQHSRTDSRFRPASTGGGGGGGGAPPERGPRVQFQMSRQGSHDDILNSAVASQGSPGDFDEEHDPDDEISPEEALIRRIWETRVIFESDGVQSSS